MIGYIAHITTCFVDVLIDVDIKLKWWLEGKTYILITLSLPISFDQFLELFKYLSYDNPLISVYNCICQILEAIFIILLKSSSSISIPLLDIMK